jgi:flagellar biosynthesis protein FliQ
LTRNKLNWILRNFYYNLRLSGWLPLVVGALVVGGFLALFKANDATMIYLRRVIEVVIPLAFGLHAAFVFAPENEPTIEVLLSCPKPLSRLLGERLLTISLLHGCIALGATLLIAVIWNVENLGLALVRWLVAGIVLGGMAVFTTQLTRQAAFGALMTTLLWASSLYGGDALVKRWPWAWPAHIYLQPEKVSWEIYSLNRFALLLVGLALMILAGVLLRNDERTLGSK